MAIPSLTTDLAFILADAGQTVTFGLLSTDGFVRLADQVVLEQFGMGGQIARTVYVTIRTGSLSGLAQGSTIATGGKSYKVSTPLLMDDGATTRFLAKEV